MNFDLFRSREIQTWVFVSLIAGVIGYVYTDLVYLQTEGANGSVWLGLAIGMTIGAATSGFELFFVSSPISPLRRLAFIPALVTKLVVNLILIYSGILFRQIIYDQLYGVGIYLLEENDGSSVRDVVFSFIALGIVMFCLQMRLFIGGRTLKNLVIGKYNKPQSEERIFLFLDIAGSTAAAEELGDVKFHRYLNHLFILFDNPISRFGGEVHSYVGDAIIAVWPLHEDRNRNVCVFQTLEEIQKLCVSQSSLVEKKFGIVPKIRAAIHGGSVVVGETGYRKRQITYLGNTVNVAARIEAKAKDLGENFLVSDTLLKRSLLPAAFSVKSLGEHHLKGARQPVELSALEISPDVLVAMKAGNIT